MTTNVKRCAHHRFVKTTPKPSATKKSKGELGPLFPPLEAVVEAEADAAIVEETEDVEDFSMVARMRTNGEVR